jgi:nucleotide-binding universal stress UspA family protein
VVREAEHQQRLTQAVSTIIVATDFSPVADRALEIATVLAARLGDELEICHVHEVTSYLIPPARNPAITAPAPSQVRNAEKALAERVVRVQARDVACRGHAVFGSPAIEIVSRAAKVKPRMLVLGSRGQSRRNHLLIGGVAERVVQETYYPVLVVPDGRR